MKCKDSTPDTTVIRCFIVTGVLKDNVSVAVLLFHGICLSTKSCLSWTDIVPLEWTYNKAGRKIFAHFNSHTPTVCVSARACVRACVFLCMRERERDRETESESGLGSIQESKR